MVVGSHHHISLCRLGDQVHARQASFHLKLVRRSPYFPEGYYVAGPAHFPEVIGRYLEVGR